MFGCVYVHVYAYVWDDFHNFGYFGGPSKGLCKLTGVPSKHRSHLRPIQSLLGAACALGIAHMAGLEPSLESLSGLAISKQKNREVYIYIYINIYGAVSPCR